MVYFLHQHESFASNLSFFLSEFTIHHLLSTFITSSLIYVQLFFSNGEYISMLGEG